MRKIDWRYVAHLAIGTSLCVLAAVLAKTVPELPGWGWGLVGLCGVALVGIELPQAGQRG